MLEQNGAENWRPIPGFEGFYEVSDRGGVRGVDRILRDGRLWKGMILYQKIRGKGYRQVRLCRDKRHSWHLVHRLILTAFVSPAPCGMQGAHNDGNPSNNRVENLRWDTAKENQADKKLHGTYPTGERNNLAKLSSKDVVAIRRLHRDGMSGKHIAKLYNVTSANISCIIAGKTWSHFGDSL